MGLRFKKFVFDSDMVIVARSVFSYYFSSCVAAVLCAFFSFFLSLYGRTAVIRTKYAFDENTGICKFCFCVYSYDGSRGTMVNGTKYCQQK